MKLLIEEKRDKLWMLGCVCGGILLRSIGSLPIDNEITIEHLTIMGQVVTKQWVKFYLYLHVKRGSVLISTAIFINPFMENGYISLTPEYFGNLYLVDARFCGWSRRDVFGRRLGRFECVPQSTGKSRSSDVLSPVRRAFERCPKSGALLENWDHAYEGDKTRQLVENLGVTPLVPGVGLACPCCLGLAISPAYC